MAAAVPEGGPVSLFRRAEKPAEPIESTKLARFPTGQVMDVIETSLMNAQISYDALRRSSPEQLGYHLHLLRVELQQAHMGAMELESRESDL